MEQIETEVYNCPIKKQNLNQSATFIVNSDSMKNEEFYKTKKLI